MGTLVVRRMSDGVQEDGAFVRVKLVHQETMKSKVLSLKQDLKYWPTWRLTLDPATSTWTRTNISTAHL